MSVVTKGPWILPDLFVIYDFVKKKLMLERERKREQEMPIFVLSIKCKYRIQGVRQPLKRYSIIINCIIRNFQFSSG